MTTVRSSCASLFAGILIRLAWTSVSRSPLAEENRQWLWLVGQQDRIFGTVTAHGARDGQPRACAQAGTTRKSRAHRSPEASLPAASICGLWSRFPHPPAPVALRDAPDRDRCRCVDPAA